MKHDEADQWARPIDAMRRLEVMQVLEHLVPGQQGYLMSVIDQNPSAGLPYHGTPHLYVVALGAYELSVMEQLSSPDTTDLFLAALFHDFNHQLSADDTVNIKSAVEAVREHLWMFNVDNIASLVASTCFPYTAAPQNISEAVIRDADIIYSTLLMPDAQRFRNGLQEERNVPATEQDSIAFVIGHGVQTKSAATRLADFFSRRMSDGT